MPYVMLRRRAAATTAAAVLAAVGFAGLAAAAIAPGSNAPPPYAPGQGSASNPTTQSLIMKGRERLRPDPPHRGC